LELVRSGDLLGARAAFERAYQASPHYLVLHNLARVSRDLGDLEAAKVYLERYLKDGAARIPPERRDETLREIASIERVLEGRRARFPEPPAPRPPAADPSSTAQASVRPALEQSTRSQPAPWSSPSGRNVAARGRADRRDEDDERTRRAHWSGFSFGLAATGLALAVTGTSILIWDQQRRQAWSKEDEALADIDDVTVYPMDEESLQAARELQRRTDENNALADSIRDFDVVGWSAVASGSLLVAGAAVLWLTAGKAPEVRPRRSGLDLVVRF